MSVTSSTRLWHEPAVPRHVVQMVPLSQDGSMLFMHRTDKVRSARDVWSFPSGMHEIGETLQDVAYRELQEEYGLVGRTCWPVGVYENVAGDDDAELQFHWVITLVAVVVDGKLEGAVNREPEKHDRFCVGRYSDLATERFFDEYQFHRSFDRYGRRHGRELARKIEMYAGRCIRSEVDSMVLGTYGEDVALDEFVDVADEAFFEKDGHFDPRVLLEKYVALRQELGRAAVQKLRAAIESHGGLENMLR